MQPSRLPACRQPSGRLLAARPSQSASSQHAGRPRVLFGQRVAVGLVVVWALGLSACTAPPADDAAGERSPAAAELHAILDEAWEAQLEQSPLFATQVGDRRADDRLDDESLAAIDRRADQLKDYLGRLEALDVDGLDTQDQINARMFGRLLRERLEEHRFRGHLIPITNREGYHISFARLPANLRFAEAEDYRNFIARMKAFPEYSGQFIERLRLGIAEGLTLPRVVLAGYETSISAHVVDEARDSVFWAPFERFPARIVGDEADALRAAGEAAILESVVPAYRELLAFFEDEYLPACRESLGASELPDGRAYYEHRVRQYTTLDVTPEEVHEIGLNEVRRIRGEMEEIIRQVGFEGSFEDFLTFLRTDPRFYATSGEELLQTAALISKRMDGALPELFSLLPRTPYGLKPIPDFIAPKTTAAYYSQPAGDGTRAGTYFLNTYDLPSRPLYALEALSLHEAVPGHHLQLALQQELTGMPSFRRFYGATAFVEGWALYAERLGLEVGFYEDPYSDFGRLTYEMWRACRLVLDTGIHALGWTRQQAIDFLGGNTALSLHEVTTEVDRYIAWPGQALAYKMGEIKIRDLRAEAEKSLGERFDLREFHRAVLENGSVPLDILERQVQTWVDSVPVN